MNYPTDFSITDLFEGPWDRRKDGNGNYKSWHGEAISVDGCPVDDFDSTDIARILALDLVKNAWDGRCNILVQLQDKRYVAWETWYEPTGSGFCDDAYGGNADIIYAYHPDDALTYMSEKSRERLAWATSEEDAVIYGVLRDAWLSGTFSTNELVELATECNLECPAHKIRWLTSLWSDEQNSNSTHKDNDGQ